MVEEIRARHSRYAWVGFTDENCIVRASTEKSLDGMNVEARPWCAKARKNPFVGDIRGRGFLVGIDSGPTRFDDYTHVPDDIGDGPIGGGGDAYADYLDAVVRPLVARPATSP